LNLYIAGICGTFMAGIAQIARELGHRVRGCDANVYPPMSTVLSDAGIEVRQDYDPALVDPDTDRVIIGNALSRGNPLVEHVLDAGLPYCSGPAWLAEAVLPRYRVIAVAGTHGKTTTASMLAWILQYAGRDPGFLIGGKPGNFPQTARIGTGADFVIEADEYDTAFFDKRSKFVHYGPRIAVLNNLEFDHADIFDNLKQIQRQFHHLVRIVPASGCLVVNADDENLAAVLKMGAWSRTAGFSINPETAPWGTRALDDAASDFEVLHQGAVAGRVRWQCIGNHNMQNALAAIVAAVEAGLSVQETCAALAEFRPSARRMQRLHASAMTVLYEDFAHHPTAIARSLEALRAAHPGRRLVAIIEPRSNTMRLGHDPALMGSAIGAADEVIFHLSGDLSWDPLTLPGEVDVSVSCNADETLSLALQRARDGAVLIAMSNGGFDGIPAELARRLGARAVSGPDPTNPPDYET
jgi:UDP-N-acetylmuramate: L-alanyl-gamma-D-glutamyl-meso-diaminopimelate ligase